MRRFAFICLMAILLGSIEIPKGFAQSPSDDKTFTMALTGDCIITRKLSVYQEPEYLEMIDLIRSADVAFTNLEMLFHDYEFYPMHQSGGTYMRAAPDLAKEIVWAGFDMISRANNHAGDYGVEGMRLTTKYTEAAGLVHSGVGRSLSAAREARFLETPKARVALISCASTFPDHIRAGKTRGDISPRPGLNPLRFLTTYVVKEDQFVTLQKMMKHFDVRFSKTEDTLKVKGYRFVKGDEMDVHTEPLPEDLEEITLVVQNACHLADYTIVSIHAHESKKERVLPADFILTFAHTMIDAGADVVVGHGPHILRGIEIYNEKPIFYSLSNFVFQNETLLRLPHENYKEFNLGPESHVADFNDARYDFDQKGFPARQTNWESVIAVPHWDEKKLIDLKLHPITLGYQKSRTVRGRPMLADQKLGQKIINDLNEFSKSFDTIIDFKDGVGIVRLSRNQSN